MKPVIIALCGKGGVGKTCVSAMITRILSVLKEKRILIIDGDPAVGLSTALNIPVQKTVNDIRNEIINGIKSGRGSDKGELLTQIDYEFLDALEERSNLAFLAIGRPEDEGCYCQVNTFLKGVIKDLASGFDFVLIDGEAGIEQVNRRVMEMVTHLLLVSDTSAKGRNVAETISEVAAKTMSVKKMGIIINRIKNAEELQKVEKNIKLPMLGWIPEDRTIADFDIEGKSFFELPDCEALKAVEGILNELYLLT